MNIMADYMDILRHIDNTIGGYYYPVPYNSRAHKQQQQRQ